MSSCEFCKISKKIFFYRTPPVAASASIPSIFELPVPWNCSARITCKKWSNTQLYFAVVLKECRKLAKRAKSSYRRCSVKKGALKDFTNFTGEHLSWSFFLIKLQALTQLFSSEICEIFKNTYSEEHLSPAASKERQKPKFWKQIQYKTLSWSEQDKKICKPLGFWNQENFELWCRFFKKLSAPIFIWRVADFSVYGKYNLALLVIMYQRLWPSFRIFLTM